MKGSIIKSPTNVKDTRAESKEVKLSEAFKAYREVIAYKNQSQKTEENHVVCRKALIRYFGDIPIEDLTFPMIRKWKIHLEKGRSDATVRNYIVKLRVVLGYCKTIGIDCISPEEVPIPKRKDTNPIYLTKDEVRTLIESTSSIRSKAIISLLFSSGVRASELCSLNRDSIKDCTFTIIGKGGRARLCFIDDRTCDLLKEYLRSRDDDNPALFISRLSKKRITPSNIQEIFKHLRHKTGIEVHCHTLRHSFATNLLKTNTNLFYVSRFLGHKSLDTTKQYLHLVDEDLHNIYRDHHTI